MLCTVIRLDVRMSLGRWIFDHDLSSSSQPVGAGCSQAQVTSTLPCSCAAIISNAVMLVSRSSTLHPVHLSTTLRSTLLCSPAALSKRDARNISPQRGLAFEFPPLDEVEPAASNKMCDTATIMSLSEEVIPQAPSPVP